MRRRKLLAFTITEMMVVISIIGILATLATWNAIGARYNSNYTKVNAEMYSIVKAAKLYNDEYSGAWPTSSVNAVPQELDSAHTNYLPSWPTPPCQNFQYDWVNRDEGVPLVKRLGVLLKRVNIDTADPSKVMIIYYSDVTGMSGYSAIVNQNNDSSPTPPPTMHNWDAIPIDQAKTLKCSELFVP